MAYVAGGVSGALRGEGEVPGERSRDDGWPEFQGVQCTVVARGQAGVRLETFQLVEHEKYGRVSE